MLLRYNIKNTNKERNIIDVSDIEIYNNTDEYYCIKITTHNNHNLNIGDIILLNRIILKSYSYEETLRKLQNNESKVVLLLWDDIDYEKDINGNDIEINYDKGYYWLKEGKVTKISNAELDFIFGIYNSNNDNFKIINENFTKNTFSFKYFKYNNIYIEDIFNGDNVKGIRFRGNLGNIYNKGDVFPIIKRKYYYTLYKQQDGNDNYPEVEEDINGVSSYLGYDRIISNGNVYEWTYNVEKKIDCTYVSTNYFICSYSENISINDIFEVRDNRFIDNLGNLYNDITYYEYRESIYFNIPISNNIGYGLNSDDIIKNFFNERKKECLPNIIDYEKRCFTPYKKNENGYLENIKFNVFLRDRTGCENWNTNDSMGWNQYKINENGKFKLNDVITEGDLIGVLGFTDDDVFYQKKKITKSFLRLSFYDNNNPLNQMLLYYSTIFLDSNDLYGKYIENIDKKIKNKTLSLVNEVNLNNPLTLSFNLYDKYNRNKSSEGYYLHLFPDILNDNSERIIYMKAEFNHAGYGKTIPLIYPNNGKNVWNFGDVNFPESLITENNNNLSELYRQMYIPITIKYSNKIDDYIYYFNLGGENDNNITLNLYEPKLNPIV